MLQSLINQVKSWLYGTCPQCGKFTAETNFETRQSQKIYELSGGCLNEYHKDQIDTLERIFNRDEKVSGL